MKLRYERQLPRRGPSTLRPTVTSMPQMAVDACWSVILQRKWENSQSDAEELVCSGLAYLERTAKDQW